MLNTLLIISVCIISLIVWNRYTVDYFVGYNSYNVLGPTKKSDFEESFVIFQQNINKIPGLNNTVVPETKGYTLLNNNIDFVLKEPFHNFLNNFFIRNNIDVTVSGILHVYYKDILVSNSREFIFNCDFKTNSSIVGGISIRGKVKLILKNIHLFVNYKKNDDGFNYYIVIEPKELFSNIEVKSINLNLSQQYVSGIDPYNNETQVIENELHLLPPF